MVRFYSTETVSLNNWNHLTSVVDDEKKLLYLMINNKVVNVFDLSINGSFVPSVQDLIIGKNDTEHFEGYIDQIEIYNTNLNPSQVVELYHKSLDQNLVFRHDFENVDHVNNIVYDEAGTSHGSVINPSANPSEDFVGILNQYVKNGKAFESLLDQYIAIPTTNKHPVQGTMMNSVSFMGWVKPDSDSSYSPIVNKNGVFSFAINKGFPELKLGNGLAFHRLPQYSQMNMDTYMTQTPQNARGSLLNFEDLNDLNKRDEDHEIGAGIAVRAVQPEIVEGRIKGTTGIRVTPNSYLQIPGQNRVNLNMDSMTFGTWIKFDDVSGLNQPIFTKGGLSPLRLVLNNGELELKGLEPVNMTPALTEDVLLDLSLNTTMFDYSSTSSLTFADGVLTSSAMSHTLSKTEYTLPLYVECTLKPLTGDTTLLVTTETLNTRSNFKSGSSNSIVWGTGSHGTSKYAWAVSGTYSNGEDTDDHRGSMTKFSMFIDETQVIMYQGEGVEKYRFDRATYPSFWDSVVANNGKVRIGTWDFNLGQYSNYKVALYNPWAPLVAVTGMDSPAGGSIDLETFEYGTSKWLQNRTDYFFTIIPDELLGGTKTTSIANTTYTNVSFTLSEDSEVYACYPQWMSSGDTLPLVTVLDGMSFDPIDTTLILGMRSSYTTDFTYSHPFHVRKRMFSKGTHVFPSLGKTSNGNAFITLVFKPIN